MWRAPSWVQSLNPMEVERMSDSVWRTWKPYALVAVIAAACVWWYTNQSSIATLRDGEYRCQAVFVNEAGKYEVLQDSTGQGYVGVATVQGGEVVGLSGASSLTRSELAHLTLRTKGNKHFHVTDDPAVHSYYAIACDYVG